VPSRLESFLTTTDLEELSRLAIPRDELTPDDDALIRRTLTERDDPLGRRNLLLQPETIPSDLVARELLAGLNDPQRTLVLASVAGSHRARTDMDDPSRRAITARLIALLDGATPQLIRRRASATLLVLAFPDQAAIVLPCLDDDDPVVRHNVRALVVRVLGPQRALAVARDGAHRGDISSQALHFVDTAVDAGKATNHDLIMRGVLAPHLAPITEHDIAPTY
jgi:hypothetical protein